MERNPDKFWNPYLAGVALGLVLLASISIMGMGLGASGASLRMGVAAVGAVAPGFVEANPGLARAWNHGRPFDFWLAFEVLGVLLGGFVGAYTSGRLKAETLGGPTFPKGKRLLFALAGRHHHGSGGPRHPRLHLGPGPLRRRAHERGQLGLHVLGLRGRLRDRVVRPEGVAMNLLPFWSLSGEARELGLVVGVLIGFGFGFVLERAGFGRATKLAGQFYGTDMTVLKVMFGAIVTAMLGTVVLSGLGLMDLRAVADYATSSTFLWPMIVGGFALGVGFIVSGYCPGTSMVAMASGKWDGLMAVVGVIVGQVAWTSIEHYPAIARLQNASDMGHVYLYDLLGLPPRVGPAVVALAVAAMAIGAFLGAQKIQDLVRSKGALPAEAASPSTTRMVFAGFVAFAVVGLATMAVPTGSAASQKPVESLTAMQLARRVLDQPWKVRVIDVRPMAECAAARVPGSECVPAADLGEARSRRRQRRPGAGHRRRPGPRFRPPGGRRVSRAGRALAGGFPAWSAFALTPPEAPAAGASPEVLESYRLRAGIAAAMTGVKAAPPPPCRWATAALPGRRPEAAAAAARPRPRTRT